MQPRAEATRSRILTAAAEVFEEQGYTASPLTVIMSRAGVTKGALYFHFSSKQELARAVVAEQRSWSETEVPQENPLQTLIDTSHDFARALQSDVVARAGVRIAIEHGVFTSPDPAPYRQWVGTTGDMLAQAQRNGDIRPCVDTGCMAEYIVATFTGIQVVSQVLHDRSNLRDQLSTMWRSLIPLLVTADVVGRFDPAGRFEPAETAATA
ncbi:MAG TPA: ScbR family autoregulator-binding transcription factor [Actinocrinis sp.]|nr:ScbR family autoregulator-binding transcription factor [Actinocrinis sp.]